MGASVPLVRWWEVLAFSCCHRIDTVIVLIFSNQMKIEHSFVQNMTSFLLHKPEHLRHNVIIGFMYIKHIFVHSLYVYFIIVLDSFITMY